MSTPEGRSRIGSHPLRGAPLGAVIPALVVGRGEWSRGPIEEENNFGVLCEVLTP